MGIHTIRYRHAPSPLSGGPTGGLLLNRRLKSADVYFGGPGTLSGIIKINTVPASRRVGLFESRSKILVGETWSDPVTGAYSFPFLSMQYTYFVVAFDYSGSYNAVLADRVTPV